MLNRKPRVAALLAVCLGFLLAGKLFAEPQRIVSIEGITEYRLENGLQVLLFPDSSRPTVTVNLTVFVGSRHEGYGEAGMAHLLEHMLFKGTPSHQDIPKLLQERGARFNGTTWLDRTNYYETLPVKDDNLEFALRLEADRMMNSYIKGEDLASEMTVVRNEFERGENSPQGVLRQRMASAAYEWHNYGQSTIGNRSDIERVPIPKLRAFYRRFYQPDNAMLVIAGNFQPAEALTLVQKHFGKIPRPQRELDRTYTEEPAQDGERITILRRVGDVQLVGAAYHIPAGPHEDYAAVDVLGYVLAIEPAGRLYKTLVETKKATGVFGGTFALHDPGLLFMMAEVRKDNSLEEVKNVLIEEIEKIGKEGVTDEEVARVKTQILKQRELSLANSGQIAIELSEWAGQGDWRLFFLYRDRIEQVTAQDVQEAAARYLRRNNRTVGMFIPTEKADRVTVPSTPDPTELVKDYKGREAVAAGEQFDPSPQNIERRTTRSTLPSGIKVALLPKKTRAEAVHLSLSLRYGSAQSLAGKEVAASLLPSLMERGTQQLTYQQLQDQLDQQKATLRGSGSAGSVSFSIRTKRSNLPEVLKILKQVLREPTLPAEELEVLRRQRLAGLEQSKSEPQALAPRRMVRVVRPYPKGDVRYTPTIDEEIERVKAVTIDQVRELYEQFLNGQHGELAIVGDFDPDEVLPLVNVALADWESENSYERIAEKFFPGVSGEQVKINTPDKANAVYYAGLTLPMKDTDEDYPALVIGDFILGGGSLSSRLGNRVRQKEGLSYGVGSGFRAGSIDRSGGFTLFAISNPDNSPKVVQVIREEIDKLLKDGISEDELARAKSGYLEAQKVSRTRDSRLAGTLSGTLYAGRTMEHYVDVEEKIKNLTTTQVETALRKHLDVSRLVVVTAGDFESK